MKMIIVRVACLVGTLIIAGFLGLPSDAQAQLSAETTPGIRAIQPDEGGEDLFDPADGGFAAGNRMIEQDIELDLFVPLRGNSGDLPITRFPSEIMSPAQIRQLRSSGVSTARDLIALDPEILAPILKLSPRDAHRFQTRLRSEIR